jgi:hypothetical protein
MPAVVGLDLDGVVVDLSLLKRRIKGRHIREEDTILVSPEKLPPVPGVDEVFNLGWVKAIITRRLLRSPVEQWFRYWFGRVLVPIYCIGPNGDKAEKCKELGIEVFVDDDYFIVEHLKGHGIRGLWFTVEKDGNLYEFLKREVVLSGKELKGGVEDDR